MSEQLKGPWKVSKGHAHLDIIDAGGNLVAELRAGDVVTARRIVACVNACDGYETKQLEEWASSGGMAHLFGIVMCMNQAAAMVRAEKQRDLLLEALETLVEHFEYYMGDNECRPLENASSAIASVKGGQ